LIAIADTIHLTSETMKSSDWFTDVSVSVSTDSPFLQDGSVSAYMHITQGSSEVHGAVRVVLIRRKMAKGEKS
jgi:hypothetical protein